MANNIKLMLKSAISPKALVPFVPEEKQYQGDGIHSPFFESLEQNLYETD